MLPLAHIYVSTKTTKRNDPFLILGSVLPDASFIPDGIIPRSELHHKPLDFYNFVEKKYPGHKNLGLGVMLHSQETKGADFYSDGDAGENSGFAYKYGTEIIDDVTDLLTPLKSVEAEVLSHSFIEASVDILLMNSRPKLNSIYSKSVSPKRLSLVSDIVADYLSTEKTETHEQIKAFYSLLGPKTFESRDTMVETLFPALVKKRYKINADIKDISKIMDKSITMMTDKYMKILDNAVDNIKRDFAKYL